MGVDSCNRSGGVVRVAILSMAAAMFGCTYGPSPMPFNVPAGAKSVCVDNDGPRSCKDLFTVICENGCVVDSDGGFRVSFVGDDGCLVEGDVTGSNPKGNVLSLIAKDLDRIVNPNCRSVCSEDSVARPDARITNCD